LYVRQPFLATRTKIGVLDGSAILRGVLNPYIFDMEIIILQLGWWKL